MVTYVIFLILILQITYSRQYKGMSAHQIQIHLLLVEMLEST